MLTETPETAAPAAPIIELRPYQRDALEKLHRGWEQTHGTKFYRRQLVVLATGLGKTILFADEAKAFLERGERVLVLAHREELLDQAEEKIRWLVGPSPWIEREQAERQASLMAQIVTASVATLGRAITDPEQREYKGNGAMAQTSRPNYRLARFPEEHFGLIIVDEAHHATSGMYRNILDYFPTAKVLGVTATPKRADGDSLRGVFDRMAYRLDIVDGMRLGFLAPVVSHRVSSRTDLGGVRTTAGDYNLKDLASCVNNDKRNRLIVETYLERYRGRQAIVFATDVDHARALDAALKDAGVSAWAISGDMGKAERREAIQGFKAGKVDVLTNFGVLTEGFDHASLDVIINARPTKSDLLLRQIMGRGTRISEGKNRLDFLEIIDEHSEETATAAEVFGFKQRFDCEGKDFVTCLNQAEAMEKECEGFSAFASLSWSDMKKRFERHKTAPQAAAPAEESVRSRYEWHVTAGGALRIHGSSYELLIKPDPLGGFRWTVYTLSDRGQMQMEKAFICDTRDAAVQGAEAWVKIYKPAWDRLLDLSAPWRKRAETEPCTDKQWPLLVKFKLVHGKTRDQVSKAAAMALLDGFFNKKKAR